MSIDPHKQYPQMKPGTCYRQPGGELRTSREGLASLREKYVGLFNDFAMGVPCAILGEGGVAIGAYKAGHPDFPGMLAFEPTITRGKGGMGLLSMEYRGLSPSLTQIPPPVYTLERTSGNEPISTHPKWKTEIIGGPAFPFAPKNGARFVSYDDNGRARYNPGSDGVNADSGFNPATAKFYDFLASSDFGGVEDFLAPGSIFLKTYTSFSPPSDIGAVGSFDSPDGPAPAPPKDYAWFFLGESFTDEVALYRIQASWKLVPSNKATKVIYSA